MLLDLKALGLETVLVVPRSCHFMVQSSHDGDSHVGCVRQNVNG